MQPLQTHLSWLSIMAFKLSSQFTDVLFYFYLDKCKSVELTRKSRTCRLPEKMSCDWKLNRQMFSVQMYDYCCRCVTVCLILTSAHQLTDAVPGSVFLLSRGTFSCPTNLLPWRSSSSSGVYKKSHRRALSSENVPGLERLLKAWALVEFPQALTSTSGPQGPLDPYEPLLPLLMGPCMGLWRECYLRGALHAQVCQQSDAGI